MLVVSTELLLESVCSGYLEVQRYEREDQRLEILHQIVENAQALRVFALVDIDQRADFRSLRR